MPRNRTGTAVTEQLGAKPICAAHTDRAARTEPLASRESPDPPKPLESFADPAEPPEPHEPSTPHLNENRLTRSAQTVPPDPSKPFESVATPAKPPEPHEPSEPHETELNRPNRMNRPNVPPAEMLNFVPVQHVLENNENAMFGLIFWGEVFSKKCSTRRSGKRPPRSVETHKLSGFD